MFVLTKIHHICMAYIIKVLKTIALAVVQQVLYERRPLVRLFISAWHERDSLAT